MSESSGTPAQGGIGIHQAQDAIADILAADDGDTQGGEAQQPEAQAKGAETEAPVAQAADEAVEETVEDDDQPQGEEQPRERLPQAIKVKVAGEEVEVTLDELARGYSRTADYSRKTQQLAEDRKAFQTEAEAIRQERAQYATLLGALQQQLQNVAQVEAEPDWDRLYEEDPQNAIRLERQWKKVQEDRLAKFQAIEAEKQRLTQAFQQQQTEQLKATLTSEAQKLQEIIPAWKDQKVAQGEKKMLRDWLMENGASEQDINGLTKAQHVAILRKAMLYDRGQQKAQASVKPQISATRPVKPGPVQSVPQRNVTDLTRAKQRLAKTGTVNDAASVLAALL